MAEQIPPPTLDDTTRTSTDGGTMPPDTGGDSDDKEGALLFLLIPPVSATSLQRRAADVKRRQLRWTPGSPPGLYWNGDVDPLKPFVVMDYQQGDGSEAIDSSGHPSSFGAAGGVDSAAEGPARLSASSPTGSSVSEFSAPLETPPDSPTELSDENKRRAPLDRIIFSQGQVIEVELDAELSDFRIERQGYALELIIPQFHESFQGGVAHRIFKLHIDTASNLSWILGYDYCCAEVSKTKDEHDWPTHITLQDWEVLPKVHDTLMPHPDGWKTLSPPQVLVPPFPDLALYADSGIALISQLSQPRVFTVSRFYQWNQSRWRVPIELPGYRFAVAYAVDKVTAGDHTNGSLGLGLTRAQTNVHSVVAEKAFSSVLASRAYHPLPPDLVDGGYAIIFGMRPPWVDRVRDPSWMSMNRVPGKIRFSPRIPVVDPVRGPRYVWAVDMLMMRFYRIDHEGGRRRRTDLHTVDLRATPGVESSKGTIFILDTGANTSDFPDAAVTTIREEIFHAAEIKTNEGWNFAIPEHYRQQEIIIDFVFRGEHDTQVIVPGPAMPFLYQKSDPIARTLVYPAVGDYFLGVNFFQTMFVAMYQPDHNDEKPYVRLAPQDQSESALSVLPPRET